MSTKIVDGKKVNPFETSATQATIAETTAAPSAASLDIAAALKRIEELDALLATERMKKSGVGAAGTITFSVTDGHTDAKTGKQTSKGAISLYGFGRWPLTLYPQQWERLMAVLAGSEPCGVKGAASIRDTFPALMKLAKDAGKLSYRE